MIAEVRRLDNPCSLRLRKEQTWELSMANRKTRESATKQKIASGRSKRTDINLSFIDFRSQNSTKTRRTGIGWSEKFCRPLGRTRRRRPLIRGHAARKAAIRKSMGAELSSQAPTAPIQSRADFHAALRKFREVKKKKAAEA